MATYIPYTVKTTVTFGGRAITTAGFSTALFVANHNIFSARQNLYTSTDEMLADGFASGSPAIKFASAIFSGKQAPDTLYIGRAVPSTYTIQLDSSFEVDDAVTVNLKINKVATTVSYTVLDTDTLTTVSTKVATLIAGVTGITSASGIASGLITVVPASTTTPFSLGAGEFSTIYTTTTETADDLMAAIRAEVDDFSTVASESHSTATQKLYASYAEQSDMLYVFSTSDVDSIVATEDGDIFSQLQGTQQQYTMGMYNEYADRDFPEGAVLGAFLAQSPSYNFTMNLQDLVGITPSVLTAGQKSALVAKNGNWYELEYGVGAFKEGFTSNGDFIDRSRFGLWLKLRSQESMFSTMKNFADRSLALAYSDKGIQIVEANLWTDVLNVGIANGSILTGLSTDSAGKTINYNPIVETSTRASQTNSAIGQRLWEGFVIEVVYTGSIHHINSKGYVINNRTAS